MTRTIKFSQEQSLGPEVLREIKSLLDSGKVIVYPTNTIYGIGASIYSKEAVELIGRIKNRPASMPYIVMATEDQVRELCKVPEKAEKLLRNRETLLTAVLPIASTPEWMAPKDTLAVRLPCSKLTDSIVEHCGPITSTSANVHSLPPPRTCQDAEAQLGESISLYIDSGEVGDKPTTIVDFTGNEPKIIREGALSRDEVLRNHG